VSDEDPILTTTLLAAAMSGLAARLTAGCLFRAGWGHGR
jgi:hypothetical protein